MQISELHKRSSRLWSTQLPQIGVYIRSKSSSTDLPEKDTPQKEDVYAQTSLRVNTVHLRTFASTTLPGGTEGYTDIPVPQDIHIDKLIQALHQVGENFNQENALHLHARTQSWVKAITAPMDLPQDTRYGLTLTGAFGEIELNLEQLNPQKIQHFFANTLSHHNAEALRQQHARLGDHSSISTGFSKRREYGEADQKAQELIAMANALEQKLKLAPKADSPDILKLLQAFLEILRQWDIDVKTLQKNQHTQGLQAKKTSAHFSQQLHSRLERLQKLALNGEHAAWESLKMLKTFNHS